jgi:hypothetical protein
VSIAPSSTTQGGGCVNLSPGETRAGTGTGTNFGK